MTFKIRGAQVTDAEGIARVGIAAGKVAYRGILPDNYLNELSLEARTRTQHKLLDKIDDKTSARWVCEIAEGRVVGYAAAALKPGAIGDLRGLYVLPDHQGQGLGRALARTAIDWLIGRECPSMMVTVITQNTRGRKFYESLGGRLRPGEAPRELEGQLVHEVTYEWPELRAIKF